MAALNFPASPALNDTYSANNTMWKWNGTSWVATREFITSVTGLLKGNGTTVSAGTPGTDYAVPTTASTWSTSQRGTVTTDNDGSFDMNVGNNFKCTLAGTATLTFTNITAGQSGYILLVNTSGFAVSAAATTEVNATFLSTVSAAGTYLISYFSDGTNVYVTTGGAMA